MCKYYNIIHLKAQKMSIILRVFLALALSPFHGSEALGEEMKQDQCPKDRDYKQVVKVGMKPKQQ